MFNPLSIRSGFALLLANMVSAQGESPLSQAQSECQGIAQQQTGYNPLGPSKTNKLNFK